MPPTLATRRSTAPWRRRHRAMASAALFATVVLSSLVPLEAKGNHPKWAGSTKLSSRDWEKRVKGRSMFMLFIDPKCPHCTSMFGAWTQLAKEYADDKHILIAETDCMSYGKHLCDHLKIKGFPSIMYGDAKDLKEYKGGHHFITLRDFVDEHLGPLCAPDFQQHCDAEARELILRLESATDEELDTFIKERHEAADAAEREHKELVTHLHHEFNAHHEKKQRGEISHEEHQEKVNHQQNRFDESRARSEEHRANTEERDIMFAKQILAHRRHRPIVHIEI